MHIRWLLLGCSLALATGISTAADAGHFRYRPGGRYHYSACHCDFNNPDRTCVPVTSCYSEGGRCRGSCAPQPGLYPKPWY
jgi:hypothetical protein